MKILIIPSSNKRRPSNVFSVLQAEAMGLLLAASVVKVLGWNAVSFF